LRLDSTENLVSVSTCVVRLTKDCVKNRKVGYSADNPARFRLTLISSRCGNRLWCVRALHLVEERYGKLASGSWMETQDGCHFMVYGILDGVPNVVVLIVARIDEIDCCAFADGTRVFKIEIRFCFVTREHHCGSRIGHQDRCWVLDRETCSSLEVFDVRQYH